MKRPMLPGSRQEKSFARAFQTDVSGPKKQMLMFPGWDYRSGEGALCLHASRSNGLIDRRTRLVCVERAEIYVPPIREQIEALGLTSRTRLHHGELRDLVLEPHEQFDFAYFDLDHIIDPPTAIWIADVFSRHVVDGADISFTVLREDPASPLFRDCALAFGGPYRKEAAKARTDLAIVDLQTLTHILLLITLFRDFQFEIHPPYPYRPDLRSMIAFKLTGLQRLPAENPWPTIHDVVAAGQALHENVPDETTGRPRRGDRSG